MTTRKQQEKAAQVTAGEGDTLRRASTTKDSAAPANETSFPGEFGEAPSAGPSVDFFADLETLRVNAEEQLDQLSAVPSYNTVPCRRAGKSEFFRIHPEFGLDTVLTTDPEGGEYYLIPPGPERAAIIETLGKSVHNYRLFLASNRGGEPFIFPCRIPSDMGMGRSWHVSMLKVMEEAKAHWLRYESSKSIGGYKTFRAQGVLGEPKSYFESFNDALRVAFSD